VKRGSSLFSLFFFLFSFFPLFARDVTITVVDTELELPLEGAVIRLPDGSQYVCDENGRALISVPDERQVVVQAAYPGYENSRLIVAPGGAEAYTLSLRLSNIMEGRELVVEADRPGSSETRTGRSVAVSGRNISQTAEIGVVEDIMTTVKLLPGVGYANTFNSHPSIRGGFPGDMNASLDGFYVFDPYHWGGSFSIFDPRMVESAQLSHGVFSTRYGHTVSGLLDISSKNPSPTETEFELSASTSTANFNISFPFSGKGGIIAMGRVTYYDPVLILAKQLAKVIDIRELQQVNSIEKAPYIRSGILTGNYRFADDLDFKATAFWGMDGVGAKFDPDAARGIPSRTRSLFEYINYQGFITTGLSWNPRSDMLLKFSAGTGYRDEVAESDSQSSIGEQSFSDSFKSKYPDLVQYLGEKYDFFRKSSANQSALMINVQGRIDYDWELKNGFLVAAGVQEMFSRYRTSGKLDLLVEGNFKTILDQEQQQKMKNLFPSIDGDSKVWDDLNISYPLNRSPDAKNTLFTTSGYGLAEYSAPNNRFNAELGLRVDHFVLQGDGFSLQSKPALNPRLNLDFNLFKNKWILESWDISVGTGLFTSMSDNIFRAEKKFDIKELTPNRSWTSVLGTKMEFPESLSLNIEGYYKYIYDRMYTPVSISLESYDQRPQFDGVGHVWGIDAMLQKMQSRYWDGWIAYSFSWAKYRNPSTETDWYFPSFHRFHNLNLILNIKPTSRINIYTRFGVASGVLLLRRIGGGPVSYPVLVYDPGNPASSYFIEKYSWAAEQDESSRTTPSLPMDIKISIFSKRNAKKTRYELYFALENVLSLLYSAQGNTSFNAYTGEIDEGNTTARYEIPIPIPSFGFKFSY